MLGEHNIGWGWLRESVSYAEVGVELGDKGEKSIPGRGIASANVWR